MSFLPDHRAFLTEKPAQPVQGAGQRPAGSVAIGIGPQRVHH